MKIENRKQIRHINIIFPMLIGAITIVLGVELISDTSFYSIEVFLPLWIGLSIVLLVYRYGGFEYVSFDFTDDEIDIKYYRLFPFDRKYNRIVIPNELLGDFKIQKGIGNIFSTLIIYQNRGGAIAQYPPIGMAATSKSMRSKLIKKLKEIKD